MLKINKIGENRVNEVDSLSLMRSMNKIQIEYDENGGKFPTLGCCMHFFYIKKVW